MSSTRTDYSLLLKFFYNVAPKIFGTVHEALMNGDEHLLDAEACQEYANEYFEYLKLIKRYKVLNKELNNSLIISDDGFKIADSKFETLDDVEKAIKLKAFL